LAQEGLAALPQTPPLQVLPVYPPLLRDLQQQQGAIFQTVILAVRQVRQQHFLVATHRRPMYRAAVVVAVMSHKMVERGDQALQLFVTQIHTQPLYQPQDRQLLLFLAGSVPTHSLAPAQSHSFNYGPLC
jgi:hypothetical protein